MLVKVLMISGLSRKSFGSFVSKFVFGRFFTTVPHKRQVHVLFVR